MSKNITALILIVLAVGTYFTFTKGKLDELRAIKAVNTEYKTAIDNANRLIAARDKVVKDDINISEADNVRLAKILPDNVDNVRLIIDVKDNIAARHGLFLKGIKTSSPTDMPQQGSNENRGVAEAIANGYGTVSLSFSVTTSYQTFLEASLRIMDVSKLSVIASEGGNGTYDFNVEIKTYWLKQ
jgi:ribosomal protein L20A (L18A)